QYADVLHAGVLGHGAAVTVHRQVLHHVDKGDLALEVLHHAHGGVGHGLGEHHAAGVLLPGLIAVVGPAAGVDQGLARPGGAADGQLFEGPAVAAHGVRSEERRVGEEWRAG